MDFSSLMQVHAPLSCCAGPSLPPLTLPASYAWRAHVGPLENQAMPRGQHPGSEQGLQGHSWGRGPKEDLSEQACKGPRLEAKLCPPLLPRRECPHPGVSFARTSPVRTCPALPAEGGGGLSGPRSEGDERGLLCCPDADTEVPTQLPASGHRDMVSPLGTTRAAGPMPRSSSAIWSLGHSAP